MAEALSHFEILSVSRKCFDDDDGGCNGDDDDDALLTN